MRTTKLLKAVEAQSIVSHEAHPHLSIAHDSTIAAPTSHSMDGASKMYARMSVHSHGMEDSERSSVDASKNNILATDVQKKSNYSWSIFRSRLNKTQWDRYAFRVAQACLAFSHVVAEDDL